MVSKDFLRASLLCLRRLTGAAKSENGFRIHYRGDRPLSGGKFQFCWLSVGRLDRTTGVLRGKRNRETKPHTSLIDAERQRAEVRGQSCLLPALSWLLERSISCFPRKWGSGDGGIAR